MPDVKLRGVGSNEIGKLHIVTTIGKLEGAARLPVVAALQHNLGLDSVGRIVVITEADAEYLRKLDDRGRLALIPISARPTYADLIAQANAELAIGAQLVCLCNADISLRGEIDIQHMTELLADIDTKAKPTVLALTRHEYETGAPILNLYNANGLPNTLSADLWAFTRPLSIARELFYCPGQMNCDMLFAHDLISTGHELFNPCLDIVILHHEATKKDEFYAKENAKLSTQSHLWRHVEQNNIDCESAFKFDPV